MRDGGVGRHNAKGIINCAERNYLTLGKEVTQGKRYNNEARSAISIPLGNEMTIRSGSPSGPAWRSDLVISPRILLEACVIAPNHQVLFDNSPMSP